MMPRCTGWTLALPGHIASAHAAGALVTLESGSKLRARCVIGADGGNSRTARALKVPQPNYAGYTAYRSALHP